MTTKEAWPSQGIKQGSAIDDYTWGYLIQDGSKFTYDDSVRPSDDEILRRWRFYLRANQNEGEGNEHDD